MRYDCQRQALDYGIRPCQSLVGQPLEQLVAEQILEVVTPASLELSLRAVAECQRERAALEKQWQQRLERARQDTARVYRQYNAVEPDNRLVARTLERQWEEALLAERAIEEDYTRFKEQQPQRMTAAERAQIEELAHNLPAVWRAPQTGVADKRRVVRLLLERVVLWAPASSQEVRVHLHWSLGTVTEHRLTRPVRSWGQLTSTATVLQLIGSWQAEGWSSRRMAEELNATGYQTPKGRSFQAANIRQLLARAQPRRTEDQPQQSAAAKPAACPAVGEKQQVGRPSR